MLCRNADNRSSFLACIRKFSSLGMPGVLVHWFVDEFDLLLGNNTNQAVANYSIPEVAASACTIF
jgi:hypothetical protein